MRIVMDSDSLIKLARSGSKDSIKKCVEIVVPGAVKMEVVDQGKAAGFPDALEVEENIRKGGVKVESVAITPEDREVAETLRLMGGEFQVFSLFKMGGFEAIASDNQKFIRKMEEIGVPCLTPSALIIMAWKTNIVTKGEALALLENLRPMISDEEYAVSRVVMEEGES
ncbi:MAG: hypothetical protein ACE5Z5_02665 [Candidatus Bathyarchaeia archaeon]